MKAKTEDNTVNTKNYRSAVFLCVGCCLLFGDQTFGDGNNNKDNPDIHDAPAAVAAIARSAGIPVPPSARQAPAVPPVLTPKEVSTPVPPVVSANKPGLISVAEAICRYGKLDVSGPLLVYFGMESNHPFRSVTAEHNHWGLGIPAEYCSDDGKFLENLPAVLMISHVTSFEPGKKEGNFCLASLDEKIIKVVHTDPLTFTGLGNPEDPKIVKDCEDAKNFWLARAAKANAQPQPVQVASADSGN